MVNFKLADRVTGAVVVGFGSKAKAASAAYASYPNLAFSLAKLVPSAGGTPSKWVNYIVTTVPTTVGGTPSLSRPSTDNTGTLVDNGDGTYKYTFFRDVAGTKALVDSLTAPAGSNKADLDDLTYDANATHRLTIQIAGNAPGTGTNTPNAVQVVAGVPMSNPVNAIYDVVPATGQAPAASANRKMVANANCESCHSTLGGLPGQDEASLVFHGGSRNNIEYCVMCPHEPASIRAHRGCELSAANGDGLLQHHDAAIHAERCDQRAEHLCGRRPYGRQRAELPAQGPRRRRS